MSLLTHSESICGLELVIDILQFQPFAFALIKVFDQCFVLQLIGSGNPGS